METTSGMPWLGFSQKKKLKCILGIRRVTFLHFRVISLHFLKGGGNFSIVSERGTVFHSSGGFFKDGGESPHPCTTKARRLEFYLWTCLHRWNIKTILKLSFLKNKAFSLLHIFIHHIVELFHPMVITQIHQIHDMTHSTKDSPMTNLAQNFNRFLLREPNFFHFFPSPGYSILEIWENETLYSKNFFLIKFNLFGLHFRSVEQLSGPPPDLEPIRRNKNLRSFSSRSGVASTWGSISRVFSRSRHRKAHSPSSHDGNVFLFRPSAFNLFHKLNSRWFCLAISQNCLNFLALSSRIIAFIVSFRNHL